jgi:hypothetical protein
VIECLPSKGEALSPTPSTAKKKKYEQAVVGEVLEALNDCIESSQPCKDDAIFFPPLWCYYSLLAANFPDEETEAWPHTGGSHLYS